MQRRHVNREHARSSTNAVMAGIERKAPDRVSSRVCTNEQHPRCGLGYRDSRCGPFLYPRSPQAMSVRSRHFLHLEGQ